MQPERLPPPLRLRSAGLAGGTVDRPHARSTGLFRRPQGVLGVREGYVQRGDRIAITAGVPFDVPGTTNLLKISTV